MSVIYWDYNMQTNFKPLIALVLLLICGFLALRSAASVSMGSLLSFPELNIQPINISKDLIRDMPADVANEAPIRATAEDGRLLLDHASGW